MEKTSEIIDFCAFCGRLAKLTYPSENPVGCKATCTICKEQFPKDKYTGMIFGFQIDIDDKKKRERKEENKELNYNTMGAGWRETDDEDYECQICSLKIDLDKNLQCLSCSQIFCFDCLVNWIYRKSTCPKCRKNLDKEQIRPNRELSRFIGKLKSQKNKAKKSICGIHNTECILYCNCCSKLICNKCIINQDHKDHEFLEIRGLIKSLQEKVIHELSIKDDATHKANYVLDSIFSFGVNTIIYNKVIKDFFKSIDELRVRLNAMCKSFLDALKILLSLKPESNKEAIVLLHLFAKSGNADLIEEVSNTLEKTRILRNENEILLEEFKNKVNNSGINILQNIIADKISFTIVNLLDTRNVKNKGKNSNIDIIFNQESPNSDVDIFASFTGEENSQMLCQIMLNENDFCKIDDNKTTIICSNSELSKIGTLKLTEDIRTYEKKRIFLELRSCKFDNNVFTLIEKTEKLAFEILDNDIRERTNNQCKSIINEEKENNKIEDNVKNSKSDANFNCNLERYKNNEDSNKLSSILMINKSNL